MACLLCVCDSVLWAHLTSQSSSHIHPMCICMASRLSEKRTWLHQYYKNQMVLVPLHLQKSGKPWWPLTIQYSMFKLVRITKFIPMNTTCVGCQHMKNPKVNSFFFFCSLLQYFLTEFAVCRCFFTTHLFKTTWFIQVLPMERHTSMESANRHSTMH